jgi:uncharacterized membrane protein YhaH (DUF805 family)
MAALALALALFQDSTDQPSQTASNLMGGLGVGIILFAVLFGLAVLAFIIWLFWRILAKAGMSGALSLLILVPYLGALIVLCILAFGEWKVVPVAAPYYPPLPPTPPPPAAFPPSDPPPTQY